MIRAGDNNELIPTWKEKGIASIGWPKLGNPKEYLTRDALRKKAEEVYSTEKPGTRMSWANQVWRFSKEIEIGDRVVTYLKERREYLVGTVTGAHFYDLVGNSDYPNNIRVSWEKSVIERDKLSQAAKNSLGSISTVFRIDDWALEIEKLLKEPTHQSDFTSSDEQSDQGIIIEDFVVKSLDMIQDQVDKLDPWQMQNLVGGLLQAMGYNVQVSPKGPDGGIDVLAYKDAFGFEKPIIKVQVKHQKKSSSSPEIQQLLGAHPMEANCLFVSTGGFTSNARDVAKQRSVRLIDLDDLVKLLVEWYDKMPNDKRSLIPLRKIYVPEVFN